MIGILLALQVNNWNENNKSEARLKSYLQSFRQEIANNIARLQRARGLAADDMKLCANALEILNPSNAGELRWDEIFEATNILPVFKIELEKSVFENMINTGVLENLKDPELKKIIFRTAVRIENYDESVASAMALWNDFMQPYSIRHQDMSKRWKSINSVAIPQMDFEPEPSAYVHNKEYSNILLIRMRLMGNIEQETLNSEGKFVEILSGIDQYLDQQ